MAIKSVSIRIKEEMLRKAAYVADYEGRSVNSHILVLVRKSIQEFEAVHGRIENAILSQRNERRLRRRNGCLLRQNGACWREWESAAIF